MFRSFVISVALASTALVPLTGLAAENTKPQPLPIEKTIPDAVDQPYPGTITLNVDATDIQRGIFNVNETIPVAKSGDVVLLLPEWLPGNHAPRGPVEKITGLVITVDGKPVSWLRDPVDVYAFHIDVPAGAKTIQASFQYVSATQGSQGRVVMTPELMNIQWETVSLYPAGYFVRNIPIAATVTYPDGWTAASGLPSTAKGSVYTYQTTDYETLIDSPTFAGKYYKQWKLSDDVDLNVFADSADQLEAKPEQIEAHRRLVQQAVKLFGAQHYDHYQFLLATSDNLGGIGLEHHRSSENNPGEGYFKDWDKNTSQRNLLPHEFTHSWDGKFRRGADLWTPDYRYPMRDSLLWVYEGQTQFWGYVLQARSGLVSKQDTLDGYALIAASLDQRKGRTWRPLIDTTNDPIISARRPKGWTSWQRSEDYYNEGLLIWMEVDSILRKQSGGKKSMDDFAKAFFGINDRDWGTVTYSFDDVVKTLNDIQPYDWAGFLKKRVYETSQGAPLTGFTDNGYKLVYTDTPSAYQKGLEAKRKFLDLTYSLGLSLNKDGNVSDVAWGGRAFDLGMTLADTIVAVNGQAYSPDTLKTAITDAKTGKDPIKLWVKRDDAYREVVIDYHDGLRYPHLEKIGNGEGGLDRLLTAK